MSLQSVISYGLWGINENSSPQFVLIIIITSLDVKYHMQLWCITELTHGDFLMKHQAIATNKALQKLQDRIPMMQIGHHEGN